MDSFFSHNCEYITFAVVAEHDLASYVYLGMSNQRMRHRLKLHIYRSLGITATQDSTTGEFNRAIVRRSSSSDDSDRSSLGHGKGDVNVINVDGKLSRGFYAGMFWDAL